MLGRTTEAAPYVVRVKVPDGVRLMPHRHREDRVYTVISGVFYIALDCVNPEDDPRGRSSSD